MRRVDSLAAHLAHDDSVGVCIQLYHETRLEDAMDADMVAMMGFSGFGRAQKKARNIDIGAFAKAPVKANVATVSLSRGFFGLFAS